MEGPESEKAQLRGLTAAVRQSRIGQVSEERREPVPVRPWCREDGPPPVVWTWPLDDPPALWVWSCGAWRWAAVRARQDRADGSTVYQVAVDLDGDTTVTTRSYLWPQQGLRVAHRSASAPSREAGGGGRMPSAPRR